MRARRMILTGFATLGLGVAGLAAQAGVACAAQSGPSLVSVSSSAVTPPRLPVVSTGQASGVAQNSATLTATIETQGYETTYEFDLGVDTSYGSRIFGDAGMEPGVQTFAVPLQGLAPGVTYHYRIVATSIFGTSYGVDETFTTAIYPSATLAAPVAPALVPAPLLAPASTSSSAAKAAGVAPAAHTARHGKAKTRSGGRRRRGVHKPKGRSARAGRAHSANRGGGR